MSSRRVTTAISAAVVMIDLATKAAAARWAPDQASGSLGWVQPVRNVEFTLGSPAPAPLLAVGAMLLVLVVAALSTDRLVRVGRLSPVPVGLALGGAAGNLLDRLVLGGVADFLVLGPVIVNLADAFVLAGLFAGAASAARCRRRDFGVSRTFRSGRRALPGTPDAP